MMKTVAAELGVGMSADLVTQGDDTISVQVFQIRRIAEGIVEIDLRSVNGEALPSFEPGAHIDVALPGVDADGHQIVRQYSLAGDSTDQRRYLIGVGLDVNTRGGSRYIHNDLLEGDKLTIGRPRNNFPLIESADNTVLVAGGIGITPLVSMARRLSSLGKKWKLYLCARTPERAAYLDDLKTLLGGHVVTCFDGVPEGKQIDLEAVFESEPEGTHFYCCGPASLMAAFEASAKGTSKANVHVEWFKPRPPASEPTEDGTFTIKLAKLGTEVVVPPGKSMLDAILGAGGNVPHSCCDGVCGTCETRVIEGVPDHRDSVLFGADAEANDRIIVCVSRAKTAYITLDL